MEFSNLGKHCNEKTCNQKDFLPFKCKFCTETVRNSKIIKTNF